MICMIVEKYRGPLRMYHTGSTKHKHFYFGLDFSLMILGLLAFFLFT